MSQQAETTGAPDSVLQDGRYLLLETLGRGGMGTVYRAFDRGEQRLVALKVARQYAPAGPGHPFAAEYAAWSRLDHPNVVRAYELGLAEAGPIDAGAPYLVLEHVTGRPAHRARGARPVDAAFAEALASDLLQALAHVHASGLVHRDVKPANVLACSRTSRDRAFKLTDFGLAAPTGTARAIGTFSGSIPYAAPETLLGMPVDGRADLYAVGILLYRLLTGKLPAPGACPDQVLGWHLHGPPADPARVRPGLSPRIRRFVLRLTQRDRDLRPADATAALALIGRRRLVTGRRAPTSGRAQRAALRLALDAARLGAHRAFRVVTSRPAATGTLRELAVWCQVRGLRYHRLPATTQGVAGFVLRLLLDRGAEAAACVERHDLARRLRLDVCGGQPVLDGDRRRPAEATEGDAETTSRRVVDFVLSCSRRRATIVGIGPEVASGARLAVRIAERLLDVATTGRDAPRSPGGLLVVACSDGVARETPKTTRSVPANLASSRQAGDVAASGTGSGSG